MSSQASALELNHFAVNVAQVENAAERSESVPSDIEMLDWLNQEAAKRPEVATKWLHDLITSQDSEEEKLSPIPLPVDCKTWDCALPFLLKDSWIRTTYLLAKYHLNASKLSGLHRGGRSVADDFSDKEWIDVLKAAQDLPLNWIKNLENQPLIRFSRGYYKTSGDPFTLGDASISLFDAWESHPSPLREYAVFHELSHVRSFKLGYLYQSKEWMALSNWTPITNEDSKTENPEIDPYLARLLFDDSEYKSASDACFVSKYAEASPNEDLAETIAAYRFDSPGLLLKCPDKWRFVHEVVYDGYHFDSNFDAAYSNQITDAVIQSITKSNSQWHSSGDLFGPREGLALCMKLLAQDLNPKSVKWSKSTARCLEANVMPDILLKQLKGSSEIPALKYFDLVLKNYSILAQNQTIFDRSPELRNTFSKMIKKNFADDLAMDADKEFHSAGSSLVYKYHKTDSAADFCKERSKYFSLMSAENLKRDFGSMRVGDKWDFHPTVSIWINGWMEALCARLHPIGKPLKAPSFDQVKSKIQEMLN